MAPGNAEAHCLPLLGHKTGALNTGSPGRVTRGRRLKGRVHLPPIIPSTLRVATTTIARFGIPRPTCPSGLG